VIPGGRMQGQKICVPGDISSAAYFIAAGLIAKDSEIIIRNVGINPTRDGILKVAIAMGGNIDILNERYESGEKVADLLVRSSELHGTDIGGDIIPTLIDEIPVIAVMAAFASGNTVISDAAELKVKESNRIDTVTEGLRKMGCRVNPKDDGMEITGGEIKGAEIDSHLDHRIAMSFAVAGLAAEGETVIKDAECVDISYPGFYETIESILL
jgi:3-phosphoshikimate 1-carboxyvinyltransferase